MRVMVKWGHVCLVCVGVCDGEVGACVSCVCGVWVCLVCVACVVCGCVCHAMTSCHCEMFTFVRLLSICRG